VLIPALGEKIRLLFHSVQNVTTIASMCVQSKSLSKSVCSRHWNVSVITKVDLQWQWWWARLLREPRGFVQDGHRPRGRRLKTTLG
jgi:hypothetical protein